MGKRQLANHLQTVYFATSSWEKYRTVRDHLAAKLQIEVRFEPRVSLPQEPSDGLTVLRRWGINVEPMMDLTPDHLMLSRTVATEKVKVAFRELNANPCIAMDSGFYVEALKGGFFGSCVRLRLELLGGGERAAKALVKKLQGKPSRKCCFFHYLAYLDRDLSEPVVFESRSYGTVSRSVRPSSTEMTEKSPLWRIFVGNEAPLATAKRKKTISEMTQKEYDQYSSTTHGYISALEEWLIEHRGVRRRE